MKYNLLTVSQMCDQGHTLTFDLEKCRVNDKNSGNLVATATRTPNNVYILDEKIEKCFLGQIDERWIWHRRMGHINFNNLVKINKTQAVRNIQRITKPVKSVCKHCQHEKKTRVGFKEKEHCI